MSAPPETHSWFGPSPLDSGLESAEKPKEFERLWRGFMTARVTLGLGLILLQSALYVFGTARDVTLILICMGYFAAVLVVRLLARQSRQSKIFSSQLMLTIGVDILVFMALQVLQGSNINYQPLFALPVLAASVLGSLLLALAAAAGVTLLLFGHATWIALQVPAEATALFLQAALTGTGCFAVAFLASQIATRLANVELRAERSQLAARVHKQVNELVIESLTDGILVVDPIGVVRAANPAARQLLGVKPMHRHNSFALSSQLGWQGLLDLMNLSFSSKTAQQGDITIHHAGKGPRRVRARTQLTTANDPEAESLCVMFLQDQREMEARIRTEKLASMGRMSAAVAHEIRNPLAAIVQANALLDEDLTDPKQKQLTHMVQQNAKRLGRIVEEVLHVSSVQHRENALAPSTLNLNEAAARIFHDWRSQTEGDHRLRIDLQARSIDIWFEFEHLRRILVNLLDNAKRYASTQIDSIQVSTGLSAMGQGVLSVWSDGAPMDQSVERHLFEPFFSSESRSSGLGLYICRELCEGHGAAIAYYRAPRTLRGNLVEGNEFLITFRTKHV